MEIAATEECGSQTVSRLRRDLVVPQLRQPRRQVGEALGHHVDHVAGALKAPANEQEG